LTKRAFSDSNLIPEHLVHFYYTALLLWSLNWLCPNCTIVLEPGTDVTQLHCFGYKVFKSANYVEELRKLIGVLSERVAEGYPDVKACDIKPVVYFLNPPWAFWCRNRPCELNRADIDTESDAIIDLFRPGKIEEKHRRLVAIIKATWECPACCISQSDYGRILEYNLDAKGLQYYRRLKRAIEDGE
jgi:rubredoxin